MDIINRRYRENLSWVLVVRWLVGLALLLGVVYAALDLSEDVWFREGFAWDGPVALAIHRLGSPPLDATMQFVTLLGDAGAIGVAVLMMAWFAWRRRYVDAASVFVSLGGAVAINTLVKIMLTRPRPSLFPPLVDESGFSYPSTHVIASVAVFGFLAVMLWRSRHYLPALLVAVLIPLVAFSRVYLGVHYPSDTLGAIAFGSLWLGIVFAARETYFRSAEQLLSRFKR